MATPTSYNFTIAQIDSDAFTSLIRNSTISVALDHISTVGSAASFYFKDALPDGDLSVLNNLVSAYIYQTPVVTISPITTSDQKDSDGATLSREKAAPTGYTFQLHCFEGKTSQLDSVVNLGYNGIQLNQVTPHFYDVNGVAITDQPTSDTSCVKSMFDFEPTYDYYIIGGGLRMVAPPSNNVRLSVVCVPDVPYAYGGSKPMIDNLNLKFLGTNAEIQADGRAAKQLSYNATNHTNKLRFIFSHDPGQKLEFEVLLEFFKP